jgi:hypothetical protein
MITKVISFVVALSRFDRRLNIFWMNCKFDVTTCSAAEISALVRLKKVSPQTVNIC